MQRRGHAIVPATTWALGYGTAITALAALALALSALFEAYRLSAWTIAGIALIVAGNVLIARPASRAARRA